MKRAFNIEFCNCQNNCNTEENVLDNNRLIIYHKQAASARILFFALNGSVCHCDGLPPESKIVNSSIEEERVDYPETLITTITKSLEISSNILEIEKTFMAIAKSEDIAINIYLARFTTIDPPDEELKHLESRNALSIEVMLIRSKRFLDDLYLSI